MGIGEEDDDGLLGSCANSGTGNGIESGSSRVAGHGDKLSTVSSHRKGRRRKVLLLKNGSSEIQRGSPSL